MYVKPVSKIQEKPNWIASSHYVVQTYQIDSTYAAAAIETIEGRKIIRSGNPYPANDNTCFGLLYHDVDVTDGPQPVSVMLEGWVIEDRLPTVLDADAKTSLATKAQIGYKIFNK